MNITEDVDTENDENYTFDPDMIEWSFILITYPEIVVMDENWKFYIFPGIIDFTKSLVPTYIH